VIDSKPRIPILLFADSVLGIQLYDWQCRILLNYEAGHQVAAACANFTGKTSTVFPVAFEDGIGESAFISVEAMNCGCSNVRFAYRQERKKWLYPNGVNVSGQQEGQC